MEYENPWIFKNNIFTSTDIKDYVGFVYKITNITNNKIYIGKKTFWFKRKQKGKKRRVTTESDWKKYYGSCDELKDDIKLLGKSSFKREILYLCKYKKSMSYYELREQFVLDVILHDDFYNTNVGGKWFSSEREHIFLSTKSHLS